MVSVRRISFAERVWAKEDRPPALYGDFLLKDAQVPPIFPCRDPGATMSAIILPGVVDAEAKHHVSGPAVKDIRSKSFHGMRSLVECIIGCAPGVISALSGVEDLCRDVTFPESFCQSLRVWFR
jgi:hypothetical protein